MSCKKLILLRESLTNKNLDGFIVPSCDEFLSEYTPEYNKRLWYLTGFTGSNGIALILIDKALLFTDGRYQIQAKLELDDLSYHIIDIGKENLSSWLKNNGSKNLKIGFDPKLHTDNFIANCNIYSNFIPIKNLIDEIWHDKLIKPISQIKDHPIIYSGKSRENKLDNIYNYINDNNIDVLVITDPTLVCWLLNIRGNDIKFNPVILSYLIIHRDRELILITDSKDTIELPNIKIFDFNQLENCLKLPNKKVQIDKAHSSYYFIDQLLKSEAIIINKDDPCLLMRACKNSVEIENAKVAHIKDAVALCKLIFWLKYNSDGNTELSITDKLENFRNEDPDYISSSFNTICGFKSNAAIIHYKANQKTSKIITDNGLLLIDSGGQYKFGTTDVTRTIVIGKPSQDEKENFTRVLKGHIALACAIFPSDTSGYQLDSIARYYLWQSGLDYAHGTGHGVGSYLSVHEGPQRISKYPEHTKLAAGMILSNEPGYYKDGEYGIRIENLVHIVNSKHSGFLEFRNLTLVPIDYNLVDIKLLNYSEIKYLLAYHEQILKSLENHIKDLAILAWLNEYVEFYKSLL